MGNLGDGRISRKRTRPTDGLKSSSPLSEIALELEATDPAQMNKLLQRELSVLRNRMGRCSKRGASSVRRWPSVARR